MTFFKNQPTDKGNLIMASNVKLVLREVRCVYPKLFRADDFMGKKRYSIGLLLPNDSEALKQLKAAISAAATAQWGEKAAEKIKSFQGSRQQWCLRETDDGYQINAKRSVERGAPVVVDQHRNDLTEESGLPYAGCWVNASIVVCAYNRNGAQGVTCFLNGVQLVKEDEPLAGAGSAASVKKDFDDLGETGATSSDPFQADAESVW